MIVRPALFPADIAAVIDIWRKYVPSPTADLSFQDNEREFADLPGKYAAPRGIILLADCRDAIEGCIAMRRVDDQIYEMKRLYVRPSARGSGLRRRLIERLIVETTAVGYEEIRLDVLAEFAAARHLYAALGFTPAPPVSANPVPGTAFLGRRLR